MKKYIYGSMSILALTVSAYSLCTEDVNLSDYAIETNRTIFPDNALVNLAYVKSKLDPGIVAPLDYGVIYAGGRAWLDRNLGDSSTATSFTNDPGSGLYQWGRETDGHQIRTSGTSDECFTDDSNRSNLFIAPVDKKEEPQYKTAFQASYVITDPILIDPVLIDPIRIPHWRAAETGCINAVNTSDKWAVTSGNPENNLSNHSVCPDGWSVASEADFASLNLADGDDGYSKIGLHITGYRDNNATMQNDTDRGYYWTSTVDGSLGARYLVLDNDTNKVRFATADKANGMAVRCVKHYN